MQKIDITGNKYGRLTLNKSVIMEKTYNAQQAIIAQREYLKKLAQNNPGDWMTLRMETYKTHEYGNSRRKSNQNYPRKTTRKS